MSRSENTSGTSVDLCAQCSNRVPPFGRYKLPIVFIGEGIAELAKEWQRGLSACVAISEKGG